MRLIGKWRIVVEGNTESALNAPWWRKGLDYLLLRLYRGEEVAPTALEHYNIKVRQLTDNDEIVSVPPGD